MKKEKPWWVYVRFCETEINMRWNVCTNQAHRDMWPVPVTAAYETNFDMILRDDVYNRCDSSQPVIVYIRRTDAAN